MNTNPILDSIIRKIVAGEAGWTLEELQYQQNNPKEIEEALAKERFNVPVQCNCEGIMIVPYRWDVAMMKQAKKRFHVRRFLFAPEAVVLALYHNININEHVCIITDDTVSIEIGMYNIEDGVFETLCTHWISKTDEERLPMVCDKMLRELELNGDNIAQIVFARTSPHHINAHNLECVFQRPVLQVGNLTALCNIGAYVQQGILNGYVRDVLMLTAMPQAIGVSDSDGSMLQIMPANSIIPLKKTVTACITGSELAIRQGNSAVANQNRIIAALHFSNAGVPTQKRQVEIAVDIDVDGDCHIAAKDIITGEVAKSELP